MTKDKSREMEWGQGKNPWSGKTSLWDDTSEKVLAVHVTEADRWTGRGKVGYGKRTNTGWWALSARMSLALPKNHWRVSTGKAQMRFRFNRSTETAGGGQLARQEWRWQARERPLQVS